MKEKNSLRTKLLISFIGVGVLPFIILLLYTLALGESKIVNKITAEQFTRADVVINLMQSHLKSIQKDVIFLSSLELMDDILADDIDKRISILLEKKVNDFDLDIEMFVVNNSSKIISSSSLNNLETQFTHLEKLQAKDAYYIANNTLFFYAPIYASFDKDKKTGYLVLKYNLQNLTLYLTQQKGIHSYIVDKKTSLKIGDDLKLEVNFVKDEDSKISANDVIVYKKFTSILNDFYLVYAVDKDIALNMLYDFIRFMLYFSLVILFIIIYVSLRYSKGIVEPIENLTRITDKITKEQDYSARLHIDSKDEIATLTHSFNKMLETTSAALENLETQNRLRLKRFIQLIEVFNTIIQTKDENECINTSIHEIKKLTSKDDLSFHKRPEQNAIDIYVTNFEEDTKEYFGSISLALNSLDDENERNFYASIASMITLQLDRIRLIDRTTAASKAKSAFISNMSHELRTPLNAIIGYSQFLITYEELTDNQQDTVGNIESSAQYLLSMINEILDIAKIEAGKMQVRKESVNLLEIIHNSYNMLKPLADDKELYFELSTDNFEPKEVMTDAKMFQQITLNLLSNAIKFTQNGFIRLELYSDNQVVYVVVTDSGIGISKEDITKLFNDFTQVENAMQKKHKGTGLGLSLSRKMANILGGDIELHSDGIGEGSKFIFYIAV
jgi:signal transduction histidine kinase